MDIVQKLRSQRTMSMFAKSEHLYEALNHDRREAADEIARLRAEIDNIKQVEFPRRVDKVADVWRNKCDLAESEIARLSAQAQHESDCAEAYKAEADSLRDENASLSAQLITFQTAWPGGIDEVSSVIGSLRDESAKLREERDEADRRAGASERILERDREAAYARDSWIRRAKEQWGVGYNISFDVVWAEALALKKDAARLDAAIDAAMRKGE